MKALRDWLKEEVIIRIEATEMAQGVETKLAREYDRGKSKSFERSYQPRNSFTNRDGNHGKVDNTCNPHSKPPCPTCGGMRRYSWGLSCKVFSGMSVPDRWEVAKEKRLCF